MPGGRRLGPSLRRLLLVTWLVLAASWSTLANAAPFDLAWTAPAGCPSRDEMIDATYARLGEHRSDAPPQLFVDGVVAERSGGFTITLSMKDASGRAAGERELPVDRPSCKEIVEPTALVLAMMIAVAGSRDEAVAEPAAERPSPPPTATEPPPKPRAKSPLRSPGAAHERSSHRVLLGAAGVGSRGVLPSTGLGFALRALYTPGAGVLFGVEASVEQASSSVRAGAGEIGFRMFGAQGRVGLSVLRSPRFEIVPLIGARLAVVENMPRGFEVTRSRTWTTILAGPGVLVRAHLGSSVFVELLGDVEGVFVRDRFQARSEGKLYNIHEPSAVAGRAALGLGFELR